LLVWVKSYQFSKRKCTFFPVGGSIRSSLLRLKTAFLRICLIYSCCHVDWSVRTSYNQFIFINPKNCLGQRSQTRGPLAACIPREGPMRTTNTNIKKYEDFKSNIQLIGLFFKKKHCEFTLKNFFIFLVRSARPCFQSHADRETLGV